MTVQALIILLLALFAVLFGLYVSIIYIKISHSIRTRKQDMYSRVIRQDIEKLLSQRGPESGEWRKQYIWNAYKSIKRPLYRSTFETILLEYMEEPDRKYKSHIVSIAYALGFPPLCLRQIRSRSTRNIAFGSRKAGLYHYEEAIPDMLAALSVFSSETQFQILMAISRMGNVEAMEQAFDKVSRYVMINERATHEILSAFSGDKRALHKYMVSCGNDYISALFLKSADPETARTMSDDIVEVLYNGGKEPRIAAVKALGQTGDASLGRHLVKALSDADWEIRAIAAKALGALVDPGADSALAAALSDREWWVRQNAAASLLSYPDFEEMFLDAIETHDTFARDSIIYALENAGMYDVAERILSAAGEAGAQENKAAGAFSETAAAGK